MSSDPAAPEREGREHIPLHIRITHQTKVLNMPTPDPAAPVACPHCGFQHVTTCPRIKAIEYHPNGTVKRIEFHEPQPVVAGIDWQDIKFASPYAAG